MNSKNKRSLEITHLKGSGPGGQNKNKRMSGVRVRHNLTGITVIATERRSQKQNLEKALERLENKLKKQFAVPKKRKKSVPSKGSIEKRLKSKKHAASKKKLRANKTGQWD